MDFEQFNPRQCKALVEAVVQAVTVEGPARARLRLDLPIRQVGRSTGRFKLVSRMVAPTG